MNSPATQRPGRSFELKVLIAGLLVVSLASWLRLRLVIINWETLPELGAAAGEEGVVTPLDVLGEDARTRLRVVEIHEAQVVRRRDAPQRVQTTPRGVVGLAEGLVEVDLRALAGLAVQVGIDPGLEDEAAEIEDPAVVEQTLGVRLRRGGSHQAGAQRATQHECFESADGTELHVVAPEAFRSVNGADRAHAEA